jgi:hypothetical protein
MAITNPRMPRERIDRQQIDGMEELTPEQAEAIRGGSNGNFPPGQFPSSGGAQAPGTSKAYQIPVR